MAFNNCFGNGGIGAGACGSGSLMLGPKPLYEEIAVIGNGAYGTVYKGCELKTSRIVAMKRIRIQITQEGLPISTIREIAYLRQLDKYEHENVVKLLDVVTGPRLPAEQSIILIFEYVDYDLHTYMKSQSGPLGTAKIVDLMGQMLTGVDFLHANRIIHRDLKPQNILVTKDGRVKVADFGLARIYGFTGVLTSVVVTLWYRSPEVLLHSTYASSVDMWSVGCIFAELYMKRPLFAGKSDIDQLYKIFETLGLPSIHDWPVNSAIPLESFHKNMQLGGYGSGYAPPIGSAIRDLLVSSMGETGTDLLLKLLDYNVDKRLSARHALVHAYFASPVAPPPPNVETFVQSPSPQALQALDNLNWTAGSKQQQAASQLDGGKHHEPPNGATSSFQPNILKRKRMQSQTVACNQTSENQQGHSK